MCFQQWTFQISNHHLISIKFRSPTSSIPFFDSCWSNYNQSNYYSKYLFYFHHHLFGCYRFAIANTQTNTFSQPVLHMHERTSHLALFVVVVNDFIDLLFLSIVILPLSVHYICNSSIICVIIVSISLCAFKNIHFRMRITTHDLITCVPRWYVIYVYYSIPFCSIP